MYYAEVQSARIRESYDSAAERNKRLLMKYGISQEQYDEMVRALEGKCEICNRPSEKLVVDHNHSTGEVRGLLCNSCNLSLGGFKDSVLIIESAIRYLKERGGYGED